MFEFLIHFFVLRWRTTACRSKIFQPYVESSNQVWIINWDGNSCTVDIHVNPCYRSFVNQEIEIASIQYKKNSIVIVLMNKIDKIMT